MKSPPKDATTPGAMPVRGVLLIVAAFFPEVYGGAERQAHILAHALGRRGVRVTIVAPATSADTPLLEATNYGQVVRFRVKHLPNLGGRKLISTAAWVRQVTAWAKAHAESFDVVYTFHARLHALAGVAVAKGTGKPLFIKLGGGGEASDFAALDAKRFFYGRWAKQLILSSTAGFVANSTAIENDLRELDVPPDRILSFPNGVDVPPPEAVDQAIARRRGGRFIYTGRLVPDKNVQGLLQAFARLAPDHREATLTIVGDGPYAEELQRLASDFQVRDRVTFTGRLNDVTPLLLEHDVFASASMREGQSNSLLEAMAVGCIPVVASASGAQDVVSSDRGYVTCDATPESLAGLMSAAAGLPAELRAQKAWANYQFARTTIGIDAIAARTLQSFAPALVQEGSR